MTILCIGDSNTYGYDPRSFLGSRYPADVRWTERLPGVTVLNGGVNGMRIPPADAAGIAAIREKAPTLIAVMLGTNDLLEGTGAGKTAERMEEYLSALREAGPEILLIAPPPLQRGEWVQNEELITRSKKLASLYREIAERSGLAFADAGQWGVELCFDGVHFSPRGHAAFAAGLAEALGRHLRETGEENGLHS
ncbi:MAG: SGNH/GDSL hydrolase family protein [Oscillospiraceae bacterium]|nr:SGNH/GDSL hydrolase family protein [Oscillospiraceae bacterium]